MLEKEKNTVFIQGYLVPLCDFFRELQFDFMYKRRVLEKGKEG